MSLTIEVAYANAKQQLLIPVVVSDHTSIEQAILASGILQHFSEIDLQQNAVGIFGKVCALSQLVNTGDRIEIYRPLFLDPKDARKQRAKK